MCNTSLHPRNFSNLVEPLSFSTFQFLRTRNRLMIPNAADSTTSYHNLIKNAQIPPQLDTILPHNYEMERTPPTSPILDVIDSSTLEQLPTELENTTNPLPNINVLPLTGTSTTLLNHQTTLPAFEYLTPGVRNISPVDFPLMELNRVGGMFPSFLHRRPRGEKRPIPDEQKDDKYYERRKRNNEAAKKSRDARKIREDRIAFRAAFLEQENSLLRAQVMALRDELQTMRQIIGRTNLSQI
ncbi:transcription factor VBP [Lucilia sericata]|uniref:transcription factor VBP n=1 Tax=Lucilia sericata TaxID=13632 RepID=UPI0018A875E6|nr:transcription factor VBP [Lucilia sericata]